MKTGFTDIQRSDIHFGDKVAYNLKGDGNGFFIVSFKNGIICKEHENMIYNPPFEKSQSEIDKLNLIIVGRTDESLKIGEKQVNKHAIITNRKEKECEHPYFYLRTKEMCSDLDYCAKCETYLNQ